MKVTYPSVNAAIKKTKRTPPQSLREHERASSGWNVNREAADL